MSEPTETAPVDPPETTERRAWPIKRCPLSPPKMAPAHNFMPIRVTKREVLVLCRYCGFVCGSIA